MKIRLIEPKPPGHHIFSMAKLPRLGLLYIGTAMARAGHDVKIYVEDLAPVEMEDCFSADMIGISSTTSTANRAYELGDTFRAKKIKVIIGGPHVTFMADEALNHADYVARGENGIEIMFELFEELAGQRRLSSIDGLSYWDVDHKMHNPNRNQPIVLDELPYPDFTLMHHFERMTTTPIMTSWGCPFDCNFCSVTAMFGKRYRFRSAENVMEELRQKRPKDVFFYDDNLAANKKRLKELLRLMIAEDLGIRWTAQVRTDVAKDDELLRLMRDSGCWNVYIGFESVNQATLDGYHKSQDVQDIIDSIKKFHQHGIRIHGMFVLGADTDPLTVVQDTVDFALRYGIDTIMLNCLTPIPGTVLFQEMHRSGRIFNYDWSYYDALHVVFHPKSGSPYFFQMEGVRGYKRFYTLRALAKSLLKRDWVALKYGFLAWGIVQYWLADPRNKEYLELLKEHYNLKYGFLAWGIVQYWLADPRNKEYLELLKEHYNEHL